MLKKPKNTFDAPLVVRRAKRLLKKKYNKTVSKSEINLIWKNYCEYGIIRPLLKYGKVKVDKNLTLEIVGQKIHESKTFGLQSKGLLAVNGIIMKQSKVSTNRGGIKYKILATETGYKGNLIFEADKRFKKAVSDHLMSCRQPYRMI